VVFLKTPFAVGSALLPSNILYAPLAGCSDLPFRRMACRYRPGIVYCEMVKIDALVRNDAHTYRLLDYERDMHPIGAQLCGSKPEMAANAARIIEDLGFDVIDFNCGCPVDKVTKDGSGSGMLKNPALIGEVLSKVIAAVKIPVTVKVRAGWDERSINAPLITQIAEQAGAKAIAVHGRTREQGYKGPANWDYIRACVDAAKNILVIGNGDVFDAQSALRMFEHTGCDAVLVSRGTMGQPWIAEDIARKLKGEPPIERGVSAIRKALLEHFDIITHYQNDIQALLDFRRVGCWYLKRCIGAKPLRIALNQCKTPSEVFRLLEDFSWDILSVSEEALFAESESST
jgi:nifR3 family TIM-barrel protein